MAEVLQLAVAIQGVNNFSTAFSQAKSGIGGIQGSLAGLSAGLRAAGGMIALFAAQAAFSFIKSSVNMAAEFEKEMLRVQAVTQATGEEYDTLTGFARELGATTEFTATQAAEAMSNLGMAGFSVNEILEATPTVLDLATAGMVEMGTAAGITANILRAFGMDTSETSRVGDVLTRTFTSSFTTIESLGESFKLIAPIAKAAGISFEQTAAAVGKLGDAGFQGTMAGTGLRQAISKLLNPSEDAIKTMARLGVELQTLTVEGGRMRNELEQQLPALDALQTEQSGLGATAFELSTRLSEIGIESAKNNIEIQAHKTAIEIIEGGYKDWQIEINTLKADLMGLKDAMADFSLDMKKNNLEVMEIRQQADREGRTLSEGELSRIKELEEANDELTIQREKASIKQIELQKKVSKQEKERNKLVKAATASEVAAIKGLETANKSLFDEQTQLQLSSQQNALASQLLGVELSNQKDIVTGLTSSIGTQVTGTVDFVEILNQLGAAGATTSDIMEIFSTRGGSAMLALRNVGAESLGEFTSALENADGALNDTVGTMREGLWFELKKNEAASEDFKIMLGEALAPVVKKLSAFFRDELLPALEPLVDILVNGLLPAIMPIIDAFMWVIANIAGPILKFLGDNPPLIWAIIGAFIAWKISTWALNSALLANPLVLIAILIAALIALVAIIVTHWDQFTAGVTGAGEAIYDFLKPAIDAVSAVMEWLYTNIVKPLVEGLQWIVDVSMAIAEITMEGFARGLEWMWLNVIEPVWNALSFIVDLATTIAGITMEGFGSALKWLWNNVVEPLWSALKWIVDNIGKIAGGIKEGLGGVGGKIKGFFGFQHGTGLEGLPNTGPFVGHEGEIVVSAKESEIMRDIAGGKTGTPGVESTSTNTSSINIENINITANSEEEGRAAAKGVLEELESLNIRGDKEVF